jgi:DNA-binding NarL/FixJ family response regulator
LNSLDSVTHHGIDYSGTMRRIENIIRSHAPKYLKDEGVTKTRSWRRLTNDDKHMILGYVERGLSHHQIARLMNRCVSSIRLVLRQSRIKT